MAIIKDPNGVHLNQAGGSALLLRSGEENNVHKYKNEIKEHYKATGTNDKYAESIGELLACISHKNTTIGKYGVYTYNERLKSAMRHAGIPTNDGVERSFNVKDSVIYGDLDDNYTMPIGTIEDSRFYDLNGMLLFIIDDPIGIPLSEIPWENKRKSGGCYVATCVYGSYDCPEVWVLRRFRDNSLKQSRLGRQIIRMYYTVAPCTVKVLGKSRWFSVLCKPILGRIVDRLQKSGVSCSPYYDKY
jgi:hypothetical protein